MKGLYDKTDLLELLDDFDELYESQFRISMACRLGVPSEDSSIALHDKQELIEVITCYERAAGIGHHVD